MIILLIITIYNSNIILKKLFYSEKIIWDKYLVFSGIRVVPLWVKTFIWDMFSLLRRFWG
jgi:hypothetical protein